MQYTPKLSQKEAAKIYSKLKNEISAAGILDRAYFYYTIMSIFVFGGFFLSLYFITISSSFISVLLSSLSFSFFTIQIGGIFHDASHRAIFKSAKNNDILGFFACSLIAYTYRKWLENHSKHHSNPNDEDMDPDINRPMFSFSEKQLRSKKGINLWLSRIQVFLYYPVGTLTSVFMQITNIVYFIKEHRKTRLWEKLLYFVGIIFWTIVPAAIFDPHKAITIYLTVYAVTGFYIFNMFAPNHKGMPMVKKTQRISFLEQQLITSRTVKGNFLLDNALIGLNYQIEHHLFPNCPRNKLNLITPYIKKLCKQNGLEYTETGLIESNKIILKDLSRVARSEDQPNYIQVASD